MTETLTITPMLIEQFSELFHTGLRKGVHSRFSAISWNIVPFAPEGAWGAFCEYMQKSLRDHPKPELTVDEFKQMLERWSDDEWQFKQHEEGESIVGRSKKLLIIFSAAMNTMPREDVIALMHWLHEVT